MVTMDRCLPYAHCSMPLQTNQGSRSTASSISLVRVRPFARGSLGVDRELEPDAKFHLAQRPLTAAGRSSVLRLTDAIPARPLEPRYPYGVSRLHFALVPRLLYRLSHSLNQTIMGQVEKRRPDGAFATTNSSSHGKAACVAECRPGCVRLKLCTGPY